MADIRRKKSFEGDSDRHLSDQVSRDRLRSSRPRTPVSSRERSTRPERSVRTQGSSPSEPELRLRPPKRDRSTATLSSSERSLARSRVAERERAAARPGSVSSSTLGSRSQSSTRSTTTATRRQSTARSDTRRGSSSADRQRGDSSRKTDSLGRSRRSDLSQADTEKGAARSQRRSKDEREADRRLAQRRNQQRARTAKKMGLYGLIAAAVCLLAWGAYTLVNSNMFTPDTISVQGARFLNQDDIKKIADIAPNSSVITLDSTAVEDRLRENPWVSTAAVSTHLPRSISIEVSERTPAISVEVEGVKWVASSDGRWLGTLDAEGSKVLDPHESLQPVDISAINLIPVDAVPDVHPVWGQPVSEEQLTNALALLRGLDSRIVSRVVRVVAPEAGRTSLFTTDEVELDVGLAENLPEKSSIILAMLEEHSDSVVLINVRSIENPSWRGLNR